jgi:hypothetical protein
MTPAQPCDPAAEAWDAAKFHLRLALAAVRYGEPGVDMWAATAASYAARARALAVSP